MTVAARAVPGSARAAVAPSSIAQAVLRVVVGAGATSMSGFLLVLRGSGFGRTVLACPRQASTVSALKPKHSSLSMQSLEKKDQFSRSSDVIESLGLFRRS